MAPVVVLAPFTADSLFGASTIAIAVLAEIGTYGFAALLIRAVARRVTGVCDRSAARHRFRADHRMPRRTDLARPARRPVTEPGPGPRSGRELALSALGRWAAKAAVVLLCPFNWPSRHFLCTVQALGQVRADARYSPYCSYSAWVPPGTTGPRSSSPFSRTSRCTCRCCSPRCAAGAWRSSWHWPRRYCGGRNARSPRPIPGPPRSRVSQRPASHSRGSGWPCRGRCGRVGAVRFRPLFRSFSR